MTNCPKPIGGGPRAEGLRIAKRRSHPSTDVAPASPAPPIRLEIILNPVDRQGRFSAEFGGTVIVSASAEPICAAARALHKLGHSDDAVLIARHSGVDHEALRGPLGVWRQLRVREDRGRPRFVRWEPFPSRLVSPMVRGTGEPSAKIAAVPSSERSPRPGATAPIPPCLITAESGK